MIIRHRPLLVALSSALATYAHADEPKELSAITVQEAPSLVNRVKAPNTQESSSKEKIADTVNAANTEDSFKYLPNVLVRKRFIGDTDAPIASRTTGINASARSLVYADNTLLTPLIANNNQNGSPRWFMVSPEEIERIDVLYGPYSAAFPGNSYGLVANITTRMPEQLEGSVKALTSRQDYKQYGTNASYESRQLAATVGNRIGDLAFWISANHLDSYSQPVTYSTLTASSTNGGATGVGGAYTDRNRTGSDILVVGAGNLTHTVQDTGKVKLAYDFSPRFQAAYTFGIWQNRADIRADSYLTNTSTGATYWGATAGTASINGKSYSASTIAGLFAPGRREMEHHMHALSLKDKGSDSLSWELNLSRYEYVRHQERNAVVGSNAIYSSVVGGSGAGRTLDMTGTHWTTLDAIGRYRAADNHQLQFGAHYDTYKLVSPTYDTSNWSSGGNGGLYTDARGNTQTEALWLQDIWRLAPGLQATLGGRYEDWKAWKGYNYTSSTPINQPRRSYQAFSPKASLAWEMAPAWLATGSVGRALRFPTAGELYSTIQVGATYQSANPNLSPEDVTSGELSLEHAFDKGKARVALFQEHVTDAIISQTANYPGIATPTAYYVNVDRTRQRGIELVLQKEDVLIKGLELAGSLTYVDARILKNSSYASTSSTAISAGRHTPYVPEWRATVVATYRPDARWAYTLAGRYSGRMYASVDNTDVYAHTYQGFESFLVMDARVRYQWDKQWSAALGVDNLGNTKYYLFHPFPQRTAFAELKFSF